jgi:TolB-like protein/DNA-binding winged helix-turn-helix (wHTH) protein/Tfp pilus assembly protein PilF
MSKNGQNNDSHGLAEYRFAEFLVNERNRQLSCEGTEIPLTAKAFDLLIVFLKNPNRLLEKNELIEKVWDSKFVEEGNLARNVSTLRKALGANAHHHRYIVTIPGFGYRFVAEVERLGLETPQTDDGSLKEGNHLAIDGSPSFNINNFPESIDGDRHGSAAVETDNDEMQPGRSSWFRRHLVATVTLASLIVITAASVIVFLRRISGSGSNPPIKSLAVLPFDNLSGDPSQDYFSDGMTEELTQNLTQIRALKVISRPWAKQVKGLGKTPQEIAEEFKVDSIVTGTVQRSEGKIRVSAQLINAASGANIWAQTYVRDEADIVKLQSEIARTIVGEIRIKLTPAEETRLSSARTVDPDAYNEFLLGQASLATRLEADYPVAVTHYQRAVEIDPGYALAYARLSEAWRDIGIFGGGDLTDVEIPARKAALKAVELDPDLAAGHLALYYIKLICDRDWTGAEEEIKRAIDLDPANARNHWVYSYLLSAEGRNDESFEKIEKALEMGANESASESAYGWALYYARRYDEAILHQTRSLELDPKVPEVYTRRGIVYLQVGRYQDALNDFEKAIEGQPRDKVMVAVAYAFMGRRSEALQVLGSSRFIPSRAALVYLALGEKDKAFEILEKAVDRPDPMMLDLKVEPAFDSLHSDPRWEPLIRRLNIPQI